MDGLKKQEILVFMLIGKIVAVTGFSGAIITVLFDRIAGRTQMIWGAWQMMGVIAFIALGIFGVWGDIFLNDTIRPMIGKYLEK